MPKHMNNDYDIGKAFAAIEDELIASMVRNMQRHKNEEIKEDKQWSMWQAEQLKSLEKYKKVNQKKYGKQFKDINGQIEQLIRIANSDGQMSQEKAILNAIKKGFPARKAAAGATAEFFRLNDRKLDALIKATTSDMKRAETAVLRMANDQYRKIIYNAQVYANTGAGTYEKAVDMASRDFLSAGLNCVEYKNGARHTLANYARMAIRTASKRAYLQGEGTKRQEWGVHTVIVNKRGNPCPLCLPFCGKVLIDDVWSGGSRKDGKYPLMSSAVSAGLHHPNCKDSHTTYFEGISTPPDDTYTRKEVDDIARQAKQEAKEQHAKRQEERFERMAKYSLDEENKELYARKEKQWKNVRFRTGDMTSREYAATKDAMKRNFVDVTEEWLKKATPNSHDVVDLMEYTVDGVTYKVDGKHVLLDYKPNEKNIAELLEKKLGGGIKMVPRIIGDQKIKTPDYLFRGKRYDLKSPTGCGKDSIYGLIKGKKNQATNFIFDISESKLTKEECMKQIENLYDRPHAEWVENVIVISENKILKVLSRKK